MKRQKVIDFTPTPELSEAIGGTSGGDRLELMTVYAVKPDGRWCIASIEGVPMPGYDQYGSPEGEKEESLETGDFSRKYHEAMGKEGAY